MCFTSYLFSLKLVGTVFVVSLFSSHLITESSVTHAKYFPFLQLHVAGFQISSKNVLLDFHTHIDIYRHSTFDSNNIFYDLHSHNICFANVFDSFILVTMLKTLKIFRFLSSIRFSFYKQPSC